MKEYSIRCELTFYPDADSQEEAIEIVEKTLAKMDATLEGMDPLHEVDMVSVWGPDGDEEEDDASA